MLQQFAPLSDISQGGVATHLRCGGIFSDGISDGIIANFLLFWQWTNFENLSIFDEVSAYKNCAIFGHPVVLKVCEL